MIKISVLNHQIKKEITIQSASTSTLLSDLMDELGIETPRRYISDDITSWYIELNFSETHCVDEIFSLSEDTKIYKWRCSDTDDGCKATNCKLSSCDDIEVSVLKKGFSDESVPGNCGNAAKITIPKTDGKYLDFDYLGISEIVVSGELYEEPTPTSMSSFDHMKLGTKCEDIGKQKIIQL